MSIKKLLASACAVAFVALATPAQADIKIGVVLALTGPNASLGIPYRKGVELMAKEIGGEKVQMIYPRRRVRSVDRSQERTEADRRRQDRHPDRRLQHARIAGDGVT